MLSDFWGAAKGLDGPPLREQFTIRHLCKAGINEEHHAAICFGADHAPSGLNDTIQAGIGVCVFEASAIFLVEVIADEVPLQAKLRQADTNDHRADQPIAYEIDPFAKNATEHGKA